MVDGDLEMEQDEAAPQNSASTPRPPSLGTAYGKLQEARGKMDVIQNALAKLMSMGDMVKQEDVIKAAGKIVAAGVDAKGIAAMLADMPDKGELLAPWIAQHKEQIDQKEQQLDEVTHSVRHQLGVQSMQQLMTASQQQSPMDNSSALGMSAASTGETSNPLAMTE